MWMCSDPSDCLPAGLGSLGRQKHKDCERKVGPRIQANSGYRMRPHKNKADAVTDMANNPSTWDIKAGGSEVQNQPQLHSKVKPRLGYLKP